MPHRRPPVDVHEAFRDVVHDYGVPEMARKIGMPPGTLYNKANLNESSAHKPTLGEAVLVQVIANDCRIAEAMSHTLGGVHLKLPSLNGVSDVALLEMLAEIQVQSGLFHAEIKKALHDKKFNRSEHRLIKKAALRYITAVLEAERRIEGMVDE